jgi:hypothetical protein
MVHVGLHSVGTYHKKFGWKNKKIKNTLPSVQRWHSAKHALPSFRRMTLGCLVLGKDFFAKCISVPRVLLSVKAVVIESSTLPSAAFGKDSCAKCPTKSSQQNAEHSAKSQIPVVYIALTPIF